MAHQVTLEIHFITLMAKGDGFFQKTRQTGTGLYCASATYRDLVELLRPSFPRSGARLFVV